jgi:Tfp pilus assembly protein PilN
MITLNLLSQESKKELAALRRLSYAKVFSSIMLGTMLLALVFLLAVQFILNAQLTEVREEIAAVQQSIPGDSERTLEQDVRELNRTLGKLAAIDEEFFSAPMLINEISSMLPAGIQLNKVGLQGLTNELRLEGTAADRNALLALQNALNALSYVENLDAPLSTFAQREDIAFTFSLSLTRETLVSRQRSSI